MVHCACKSCLAKSVARLVARGISKASYLRYAYNLHMLTTSPQVVALSYIFILCTNCAGSTHSTGNRDKAVHTVHLLDKSSGSAEAMQLFME